MRRQGSIAGPSDSTRAPDMSSDPLTCTPTRRSSPFAWKSFRNRTVPPTRIRSAWMARSPWASMVVSMQRTRPPMLDSHNQTAALRDVLARVGCLPTMWEPDSSGRPAPRSGWRAGRALGAADEGEFLDVGAVQDRGRLERAVDEAQRERQRPPRSDPACRRPAGRAAGCRADPLAARRTQKVRSSSASMRAPGRSSTVPAPTARAIAASSTSSMARQPSGPPARRAPGCRGRRRRVYCGLIDSGDAVRAAASLTVTATATALRAPPERFQRAIRAMASAWMSLAGWEMTR